MTYVGALRGEGMLIGSADGCELGRAEYDIGGFLNHTKAMVASGELRMHPGSLRRAFGRVDLVLQTDRISVDESVNRIVDLMKSKGYML